MGKILFFCNYAGPIAGTLSNRFGFRPVIMTGSVISSIGIAVSIFVNSIFLLYLTYGIVGGKIFTKRRLKNLD